MERNEEWNDSEGKCFHHLQRKMVHLPSVRPGQPPPSQPRGGVCRGQRGRRTGGAARDRTERVERLGEGWYIFGYSRHTDKLIET